jgi:peptidoglycan/LPS O-acetylase OafA/YrhL
MSFTDLRHYRAPELDALRGLAALMIVGTHVLSLGFVLPANIAHLLDATPLRAIHTGRAPVLFFFVLSGYVLTRALMGLSGSGILVYAGQRTLRLLLPVAGAVLLSAGLQRLFDSGPLPTGGWDLARLWEDPARPGILLRQALLIGADHDFTFDIPLWTLVHEWRLSLALPAVLLFRRRPALLIALALVLHAAAIAEGVAPNVAQLGPRLASTLAATAYFALPFAAGAALQLTGGLPPLFGPLRQAAWIGVVTAAALPSDLAVIAGAVLLIALARPPSPTARWLRQSLPVGLGRISYSLYLVHMPVLAAAVHASREVLPHWVALLLAVPVVLLVAIGFHAAVEGPAHRLARWLGRAAPRLLPTHPIVPRTNG